LVKDAQMSDNDVDRERDLAEELLRQKKFDRAIAIYLKLAERHPGEDSFLLALAWAYHDSGDMAKAIEYFSILLEKELKLKVFTGFAFDELVRLYTELARFDDLIDICERAVAVQPEDIALLTELGSAYMKGGRYGQAADVYRKMAGMEPDDSVFSSLLGDALIAMGQTAEGETAYRRAVEIEPSGHASFLFRMANRLMDSGYYDLAEKAFAECTASRPDDPLYQCAWGDSLIKQAKIEEALHAYQQAVLLDTLSAGVYLNRLGNSFAKAGYHKEATEAFGKAVAMDPDNVIYRLHMAESCRAAGLFDDAARILSEHSRLP
jgi:tetratricopeptide (TPR) repeat protein